MSVQTLKIRNIPRAFLLRAAILASLIVAGIVLAQFTPVGDFLNEEQLSIWLAEFRQAWWSPLLLIGLYIVMTTFGLPTGPLLVAGSAFGAMYGSLYNVTGLFLAAAVSFLVARLLGRDFVVRITGNRLRRAERYLYRYGFWPLVQTRFLPFPATVINFGAALVGVPMRLFLAASFVGLLPSTVIHTYFIAELFATNGQDRAMMGVLYLSTFVVFNLLIGWPWITEQVRRRKRYQLLCQQRAVRRKEDAEPLKIVQT
jgi:uncharacterized membrane protein YdjX (TVP38/TMEM64 family)